MLISCSGNCSIADGGALSSSFVVGGGYKAKDSAGCLAPEDARSPCPPCKESNSEMNTENLRF